MEEEQREVNENQKRQRLKDTKKSQEGTKDKEGHTYSLRYKYYSSSRFKVEDTQPDQASKEPKVLARNVTM